MRIKKYAAAFLAATTVLGSLAACNKTDEPAVTPTQPVTDETPTEAPKEPDATPTPAATPIPFRDLGGMEIIIGDHWSPEEPAAPTNAQEEATAKYRQEIMSKYNFKIQSKAVAGWGDDMINTCVDSITANEPAAQLFELDYRFVAKPMVNGVFYDLATLDEIDFDEDKWNKDVQNIMTMGSAIYGMRAAVAEPRGGLIWNKRLFEEAGLDPDLPYDLQASGEWTWSKFEELCKTLTRDLDGDNVTDIYAIVGQASATMTTLVASTGSDYFLKDESGALYNNLGSKEVLDAITFGKSLYDNGYHKPDPEGANWDWFIGEFREGKGAMQFNEEYNCQPGNNYGDQMEDAVGFVMPPKPEGQADYKSYVCDNITIIPACYDDEMAGNVAFAYNLYTMATPGYDDPEAWKEQYYAHFEDERAVDETIVRFNDGVSTHFLNQTLVVTSEQEWGNDFLWQFPAFGGGTAADKIASIKDTWDAKCAEANKNRK
ncbi:MAG: extracellular solute-binding protein [Lachnospiraceae bacterium]|nr:extracellular solute-binding protein [Lachnospiraceae bacterium]